MYVYTTLHLFRIFILEHLYLCNYSSYELELWHEYSSIIPLHLKSQPLSLQVLAE